MPRNSKLIGSYSLHLFSSLISFHQRYYIGDMTTLASWPVNHVPMAPGITHILLIFIIRIPRDEVHPPRVHFPV